MTTNITALGSQNLIVLTFRYLQLYFFSASILITILPVCSLLLC